MAGARRGGFARLGNSCDDWRMGGRKGLGHAAVGVAWLCACNQLLGIDEPRAVPGSPDSGAPQVQCPADLPLACEGTCVDPTTDLDHCGACHQRCEAPLRGEATCIATDGGTCLSCSEGFRICGERCVDTSSDPENCDNCGHSCLGGVCSRSTCQPTVVAEGFEDLRAFTLDTVGQSLVFLARTNTDWALTRTRLHGPCSPGERCRMVVPSTERGEGGEEEDAPPGLLAITRSSFYVGYFRGEVLEVRRDLVTYNSLGVTPDDELTLLSSSDAMVAWGRRDTPAVGVLNGPVLLSGSGNNPVTARALALGVVGSTIVVFASVRGDPSSGVTSGIHRIPVTQGCEGAQCPLFRDAAAQGLVSQGDWLYWWTMPEGRQTELELWRERMEGGCGVEATSCPQRLALATREFNRSLDGFAVDDTHVYWSEPGGVLRRSPVSATCALAPCGEIVLAGLGEIQRVAVDASALYLHVTHKTVGLADTHSILSVAK